MNAYLFMEDLKRNEKIYQWIQQGARPLRERETMKHMQLFGERKETATAAIAGAGGATAQKEANKAVDAISAALGQPSSLQDDEDLIGVDDDGIPSVLPHLVPRLSPAAAAAAAALSESERKRMGAAVVATLSGAAAQATRFEFGQENMHQPSSQQVAAAASSSSDSLNQLQQQQQQRDYRMDMKEL